MIRGVTGYGYPTIFIRCRLFAFVFNFRTAGNIVPVITLHPSGYRNTSWSYN